MGILSYSVLLQDTYFAIRRKSKTNHKRKLYRASREKFRSGRNSFFITYYRYV